MVRLRIFSLVKFYFTSASVITSVIMLMVLLTFYDPRQKDTEKVVEYAYSPLSAKEWRNFSEEQIKKLSVLGRYLYLDEKPTVREPNKNYVILIWKYGPMLERRQIRHFTDHNFDPFEKCSVRNCRITYEDSELEKADAVLFHLHRTKGVKDLPSSNYTRPADQLWVFLTDESPYHTFLTPNVKLTDFDGVFNWSMSYRSDSDVPVPYGRAVLLQNHLPNNDVYIKKRSDVLVTAMGSNCGAKNNRWSYIHELEKHIPVDVYGGCGKLKCPGHFNLDCKATQDYKFYLSFENSNCAEYITEKLWHNAFTKNSIPIVMGATDLDYRQFLPPNSYINVQDFARPEDLARFIIYVNNTPEVYNEYFQWKNYFEIRNEHGYFQTDTFHYCRLCEALNYNSRENKVYNDLKSFWSTKDCYPAWDAVNQ